MGVQCVRGKGSVDNNGRLITAKLITVVMKLMEMNSTDAVYVVRYSV